MVYVDADGSTGKWVLRLFTLAVESLCVARRLRLIWRILGGCASRPACGRLLPIFLDTESGKLVNSRAVKYVKVKAFYLDPGTPPKGIVDVDGEVRGAARGLGGAGALWRPPWVYNARLIAFLTQVVDKAPILVEVLPKMANFICPKTLNLPARDISDADPPAAVRVWERVRERRDVAPRATVFGRENSRSGCPKRQLTLACHVGPSRTPQHTHVMWRELGCRRKKPLPSAPRRSGDKPTPHLCARL